MIDIDSGAGSGNSGLLDIERRLICFDRCLCGCNIGLCLIERCREIAIVDPGKRLTRLYGFVVADEDSGDIARDFGSDGAVVGFHIGIVRRDLETANSPVIVPVVGAGGNQHDSGCAEQQRTAALAGRLFARRWAIAVLRQREPVYPRRAEGATTGRISVST